jgi:hypothetical protein
MTIETKYNIGDKVHLISPNADMPVYKYIHEIRVRYYGLNVPRVYYYLVAGIGIDLEMAEDKLFPTKEELLKSL